MDNTHPNRFDKCFPVRYCNKCKRCWEINDPYERDSKVGKLIIIPVSYPRNQPSYGLLRLECPECLDLGNPVQVRKKRKKEMNIKGKAKWIEIFPKLTEKDIYRLYKLNDYGCTRGLGY